MQYEILRGDCIEVMRTLPDNSVDSIVTDPPYELTNDGKQSAARVFLEFAFPQNANVKAHGAGGCELPFFVGEILRLCGGGQIPAPAAAVPVVAMAFDDYSFLGDDYVVDAPESAVGVSHDGAGSDIETQSPQHLGSFALELTDPAKIIQILHEVGAGFVPGGVGIGLAQGAARIPSLAYGLSSIVDGDDVVGLIYHALTDLVSAPRGAGGAVLCANLGRGAVDEFSAAGALLFAAVLHSGGAKFVRTDPATCSLPTMLETRRVRVVEGAAGGAFTFDLVVHPQSVASMGFMGKAWDGSKIAYNVEMWREALRVLKPGGHLLAFSGSRTYHRMTCAIEDAGFEIRDQIMWVYGSGFPKSLDVSKAIDKAAGAEREVVGVAGKSGSARSCMAGDFAGGEYMATAPATDAARQWEGWGTALKPAHEPICVARKPLVGTVAANVLAHGTGALNIDGCRVGDEVRWNPPVGDLTSIGSNRATPKGEGREVSGRWPANLIHSGEAEAVACFPNENGKSAARFFMECKGGYNDVCPSQNPPPFDALTAALNSSQPSALVPFALVPVVNAALPEGLHCSGLSLEPSTTATVTDLKLLSESATQAIQSIGERCWHGSKPVKLSLSLSPVNVVVHLEPTGTTTITISHWRSDGSAEPVTFNITRRSLEVGAKDFVPFTGGNRLMYCAKASKSDRGPGNTHPTVKPLALMQYLVRLVTPPGGHLLDPFAGSGSTIVAALREGMRATGIELSPEYAEIAENRAITEVSDGLL